MITGILEKEKIIKVNNDDNSQEIKSKVLQNIVKFTTKINNDELIKSYIYLTITLNYRLINI